MSSWYFQWAISIKATCNVSPGKLSWVILKTQWFFIIWNTWKGFLSKPLELLVWRYSAVLSQRHWHVIADLQTEPSCFVSHETKELLTVTKIYITVINIIFTISIAIIIIIIIIVINIIINGITISIINASFTCAWRICWIRHISCNSCVTWLLTSNFQQMLFFIYFFFVQKLLDYSNLDYWTNTALFWNQKT